MIKRRFERLIERLMIVVIHRPTFASLRPPDKALNLDMMLFVPRMPLEIVTFLVFLLKMSPKSLSMKLLMPSELLSRATTLSRVVL